MAIVSFDKDTIVDYMPEYDGNRDSDDPCVVKLKFVNYARVQHYARIIATKSKSLREGDRSKGAVIMQEVQRKQFVENVDSISGYSVNGNEITSADEFYDTADTTLISEIIEAMESASKLSEGQRKNS